MNIAEIIAKKSTCIKSQVGCVIVKDQRIISMGYNGTAPNEIHCNDFFNKPENKNIDHSEWSIENEQHAELNSILFAAKNGINLKNSSLFVTLSPCINCAKAIYTVGIKNVYYKEEYRLTNGLEYLKKRINVEKI